MKLISELKDFFKSLFVKKENEKIEIDEIEIEDSCVEQVETEAIEVSLESSVKEEEPAPIELEDNKSIIVDEVEVIHQPEKPKKKRISKKQRLENRKTLIKKTPREAIDLIKSKQWRFSDAKRIEEAGFVWECVDKDDVRVVGKVKADSTEIAFCFGEEKIRLKDRYCDELESILVSSLMRGEIYEWKKKKQEFSFMKDHQYEREYYWIGRSSQNNKVTGCMYCGTTNLVGNVCDTCRDLYQKKRRGMGGYPSSDPNARGSNGQSYTQT